MSTHVNFLVKDQYFRRVVATGAYTSKEGECGFLKSIHNVLQKVKVPCEFDRLRGKRVY
jgi:hypothetical protein